MESALQQALKKIRKFGGLSPANIGRQIAAIPKWGEQSIINVLKRENARAQQPFDIEGKLRERFGNLEHYEGPKKDKKAGSKLKQQVTPTLIPTKIPTPALTPDIPSFDELVKAIQTGSEGAPVATMAAQMVKTGQKMPVFQQHPFLPVAISQLESRGFRDFGVNPLVINPKQGFGWAPTIAGYNPSIERVLEDMMSAVGTDRAGEDEVRRRSAGYYQSFRENPSDIMGFANQYAGPVTTQNPHAGDIYGTNLKTVMNKYAEILDKLMQERGGGYSTRY